jgi:hypothetical protein
MRTTTINIRLLLKADRKPKAPIIILLGHQEGRA